MIVRKDKTYETSSLYPNTNWYEDEDNYIIDETSEEGKELAKKYIDNYPFVEFEHNKNMITKVIILSEEKNEHEKELELEGALKELEGQTIPSLDEIKKVERELETINLLQELGVI